MKKCGTYQRAAEQAKQENGKSFSGHHVCSRIVPIEKSWMGREVALETLQLLMSCETENKSYQINQLSHNPAVI